MDLKRIKGDKTVASKSNNEMNRRMELAVQCIDSYISPSEQGLKRIKSCDLYVNALAGFINAPAI